MSTHFLARIRDLLGHGGGGAMSIFAPILLLLLSIAQKILHVT